ncbi:MAG: CPBP family intramembrane metalloprotease [Saprospiraceae bacterium]|nr:CPBP family intramembrane metalloprotease [Saprospiraceae bacterium]
MLEDDDMPTHKEFSFWLKWIVLLLTLIFTGIVISSVVTGLIANYMVMDVGVFNFDGLDAAALNSIAWAYRYIIFFQHLFVFIVPALVTMYIFKRQTGHSVFHFLPEVNWNATLMGVLILISAYPLVQYSSELNKLIPLPDVLHHMEDQTEKLVKLWLDNDSMWILVVNILLIALVPAISEELIFRGYIQTILGRLIHHKHITVWVTAIIFSAIHMQFEGFIPRVILGLVLGYLMMWSGNIAYPMIAHFVNNAVQVILQFLMRNDASGMDSVDNYSVPIWLVFISTVILMLLTTVFQSYFTKNKKRA